MDHHNNHNICIVAPPFNEIGPLSQVVDLTNLVSKNSGKTFLITGSNFKGNLEKNVVLSLVKNKSTKGKSIPIIFFNFLNFNFKVLKKFFDLRSGINTSVFYNSNYVFIMLLSKILGKKTILVVLGDLKECSYFWYKEKLFGLGGYLASFFFNILRKISFILADVIVLEHKSQINDLATGYEHKAKVAPIRYINTNLFHIKTPLNDRQFIIGYVGRFSLEKGVLNFIESLPPVINFFTDLKIILIGGGSLQGTIEEYISQMNLEHNVSLIGWVDHKTLPDFLNKIQLIVVPSFTEGLPGIVIESMACGVPVLANDVGGIGDIITHKKTGFLMEDNSSGTISKSLIESIRHEKEQIAKNAYDQIINEFSHEAILKNWEQVLINDK